MVTFCSTYTLPDAPTDAFQPAARQLRISSASFCTSGAISFLLRVSPALSCDLSGTPSYLVSRCASTAHLCANNSTEPCAMSKYICVCFLNCSGVSGCQSIYYFLLTTKLMLRKKLVRP